MIDHACEMLLKEKNDARTKTNIDNLRKVIKEHTLLPIYLSEGKTPRNQNTDSKESIPTCWIHPNE